MRGFSGHGVLRKGFKKHFKASTLGYYEFDGVRPGRTYRIAVTSKRYRFLHLMIEPASNFAEVNLMAVE